MQDAATVIELKPARRNPLDGFTKLTTGLDILEQDYWAVRTQSRSAHATDPGITHSSRPLHDIIAAQFRDQAGVTVNWGSVWSQTDVVDISHVRRAPQVELT